MKSALLPRWLRSSDIRTLALGTGCELSLVLSWLYPQQPTNWFILGTAGHYGIEQAILRDLDPDQAKYEAWLSAERELMLAESAGLEVLLAYRAKRTPETMQADLGVLLDTWFKSVHPDSSERKPDYEDYNWPPRVEHQIRLPEQGLYTTVDAIFDGGPPGGEVAVVDWKTGSKASAPAAQLQTYHYGGKKEGWIPLEQNYVGWFHHLTADKIQTVPHYWGDAVVDSWMRATGGRKREIAKAHHLPVANPSFLCNTCPSRVYCPVMGEDTTTVEVLSRIGSAEEEWEPHE
jgi:hypothetical protein